MPRHKKGLQEGIVTIKIIQIHPQNFFADLYRPSFKLRKKRSFHNTTKSKRGCNQ